MFEDKIPFHFISVYIQFSVISLVMTFWLHCVSLSITGLAHGIRRCSLHMASFSSPGFAVHSQGHQGRVLTSRDLPPPHSRAAAHEHEGKSHCLSIPLTCSFYQLLFYFDWRIGTAWCPSIQSVFFKLFRFVLLMNFTDSSQLCYIDSPELLL